MTTMNMTQSQENTTQVDVQPSARYGLYGSRLERCFYGSFSRIAGRDFTLHPAMQGSSATISSRVILRRCGRPSWRRRRATRQLLPRFKALRNFLLASYSCWDCSHVLLPSSRLVSWQASGSRNWVPRGFGNSSSPFSRRLRSWSEARAERGVLMRSWRAGDHPLSGGNQTEVFCQLTLFGLCGHWGKSGTSPDGSCCCNMDPLP